MIGPLLWLIYLLTNLDTERALLGSRRRFGVNMGFSEEDRILMENLYVLTVTEQQKLIKEFLNKSWGLWGLNKLSKKLQETGITARRSGSIESIQNISCFFYCVINIHT